MDIRVIACRGISSQMLLFILDVANNKLFPKTSRKREPTGANSLSKYDQTKKYNTQKAKTFDKRPKPKGQYHGGSKEDTKVNIMKIINIYEK